MESFQLKFKFCGMGVFPEWRDSKKKNLQFDFFEACTVKLIFLLFVARHNKLVRLIAIDSRNLDKEEKIYHKLRWRSINFKCKVKLS